MIFYFSATGNSEYTAYKIAEGIWERTVSITECMREGKFSFEILEDEKLGFVSPVYFCGLPSIVKDFLGKLKLKLAKGGQPYTYCVITYGGATGQAGTCMNEYLGRKGLVLDGRFCVKMPDTWTPIFNLSNKEKVKETNRKAERQIAEVAERVSGKAKGNFLSHKVPPVVGKLVHKYYEKNRLTKRFTAEASCTGCGLCVGNCTVGAIKIDSDKPLWVKEKCTLCLGCLHKCPQFAISYGSGTKKHGQYVHPGKISQIIDWKRTL